MECGNCELWQPLSTEYHEATSAIQLGHQDFRPKSLSGSQEAAMILTWNAEEGYYSRKVRMSPRIFAVI